MILSKSLPATGVKHLSAAPALRATTSRCTRRGVCRASSTSVVVEQGLVEDAAPQGPSFEYVCPICQNHRFSFQGMPSRAGGLTCPRCSRTFSSSPQFVDLTLTSGAKAKVYKQRQWTGTELFRSPLISAVYERGWRQGFAWAGFPGADKEFDMAMEYLRPAYGKVLVDMSCGSGLFSRRFARSGQFAGVIAADYSESMLQQARAYFQEDGSMPRNPSVTPTPTTTSSTPIMLLRADVARLPFATGSVAAIHAGAAIHCWPNPQAALAEISRVLAPGGVFVATTFLTSGAPIGQVLGDDVVRPLSQLDAGLGLRGNTMKYWEEAELRDLCDAVGLQSFERERQWRFIMFAASKPYPVPDMEHATEE